MRIVCAIRPASRSPSRPPRGVSSGRTDAYPARNASATSNRSVRPRTSDWSVAGTSSTSAVCAMSPKSMIPLTRSAVVEQQVVEGHVVVDDLARSAGTPGRRGRRSGRARGRAARAGLRPRRPRGAPAPAGAAGPTRSRGRRRDGRSRAAPGRCGRRPRRCARSPPRRGPWARRCRPGRSGRRRTRWWPPSTSAVAIVDPSSAGAPRAPGGRDRQRRSARPRRPPSRRPAGPRRRSRPSGPRRRRPHRSGGSSGRAR